MSMLDVTSAASTDDGEGMEEAVRVFVRIRPLNKREIAEKQTIGWNFNDTAMLEDTPNGQRVYAYDHCFGPTSTNQETYDIVGKPVVLKAMEGYNGTVFTYGQTGSGKTWTMRGSDGDPGMMVLCIRDILDWVKNHADIQYSLKVSYLEVYNEEINDLLGEQGPSSKNLKIISEDAAKGAVIGGLVDEAAHSAEEFMAILKRGEASRSYASTNMNAESSRSHTIYRVTIEARDKGSYVESEADGGSPPSRTSYLNLVDLAGSERQKSTKAEGKVLKEGANINKSLLTLGAVINKLGESVKKVKGGKPAFIPYRDSKLTRILKQSLGGNTMTSVLCAVTPAPMHREETVSTLRFGQTCKSIKNNVKSNDGLLDDKALMKQYRATIAELRTQIEELTSGEYKGGKSDPELENKLRAMESLLVAKGVAQSEISAITQSTGSAGSSSGGSGSNAVNEQEVMKLNDKISEQQKQIAKMQRSLGEYQDLEDSKANFEEYEQHIRQELDDEKAKLDEEMLTLQSERYKLLKDRQAVDEKESRIGLLITNLDEKESKLRQLMANMKEQQEQWQRSVTDLQRREDLVDDWQRNHKQREKKLQEIEVSLEKKSQELNARERNIIEEENRLRQKSIAVEEREQRVEVNRSRVADGEEANHKKEEALQTFENVLKKKEHECDMRERELTSRRKDLESWDALLREKDRKISTEQKQLDDREASIRQQEEKNKTKEVENERKALELKQSEQNVQEMSEKYEGLLRDTEERERDVKERDRECQYLATQLQTREEELKKWERNLIKLQEQMKGIEARERTLKANEEAFQQKENEFYNVKVAQITSRHTQELKSLEEIIHKQLKISADFQRDLEATKGELDMKSSKLSELQNLLDQRNAAITQLSEQVRQLESGPLAGINAVVSEVDVENVPEDMQLADGSSTILNHVPHLAGAMSSNNTGNSGMSPVRSSAPNTNNTNPNNGDNALFSAHASMINRSTHLNGGPLNPQDFITQLAITRQLIYQVLEQHDALPDSKTSSLHRRQPVTATITGNTGSSKHNSGSQQVSPSRSSKQNNNYNHHRGGEAVESKAYHSQHLQPHGHSLANHSMYDINVAALKSIDLSPAPRAALAEQYQAFDNNMDPPNNNNNDSLYRYQANNRSRKNVLPAAEEKQELPPPPPAPRDSPLQTMPSRNPVVSSATSSRPSTGSTTVKRTASAQPHQSPVSSNLNSALSSPAAHREVLRRNPVLTPPNGNLVDYSGAITNSVDRNGTPITTVDLGMRSNLRKLTKNMELSGNGANVNLLASPPMAAGRSPLPPSYSASKFRK